MKIHSLKMENFRQFHGSVNLDFSIDSNNSVTVIHGENGVGKTTILNAIYWCFYGDLLEEFEQQSSLVNDYAHDSQGVSECNVEIVFEHDGKIRRALRTYNQDRNSTIVEGFELDGGNQIPISGFDALFRRMIPTSMAPYFFFHGEGVNSLGQSVHSGGFREAIKAILGFNHADSAVHILECIRIKWQKELSKLSTLDSRAKKAIEELAQHEEAVKVLKDKISENSMNLVFIENQLTDINDELAKIKVKNVDGLNRERQALEARDRQIPKELKKIEDNEIRWIAKYGWSIFGQVFLTGGAGILEKFRIERKIPAEYNDQFVNGLLNSGKCICGGDLKDDKHARELVENMLIGATTSEEEEAVTKATGIAENIHDMSDEFIELVNNAVTEKDDLIREKGTIVRRLEEIRDELKAVDEPRVNTLETDRDDISKLARKLRDSLSLDRIALDRTKQEADKARKKRNKIVDKEKLGNFQMKIDFIDTLLLKIENVVRAEETTARDEIQNLINGRLNKFSRKSYHCDISDNFTIELRKNDGTAVAKSKGERALLNLSFIASLIELARERSGTESDYFVQGTVAPFVIDAPFGELDKKYRGAVAKFLPESTGQLITLLSSSHWDESVESNLRTRIGKEYILISESDAKDSENKTEDEIEIKGKIWKCSKYGAKIPKSIVEEV